MESTYIVRIYRGAGKPQPVDPESLVGRIESVATQEKRPFHGLGDLCRQFSELASTPAEKTKNAGDLESE